MLLRALRRSNFLTETQPVELTGLAMELSNWAKESLTNAGGPVQYLVARYPTNAEQKQFGDALMTLFPPRENITYQEKGPIPKSENTVGGKMESFCLHPALFAWGDDSSVKSRPEICTSLRLLQEYLMDGFLTNAEPLHITELMVSAEEYNLGLCSIGYIKGQARMTTLLCILSRVIDMSAVPSMQQSLPKLYESSRTIWCYRFHFENKRAELFSNFATSARGAIRKLPNTLQWAASLKKLSITEEAAAANIIKAWNANVPRPSQLTGAKSMGVRNVLCLPVPIYNTLRWHVSQHGWDGCVLSDDALQSKKILPGFIFRSTSKEWTSRGKINNASALWCFQHIINEYDHKPKNMRRKCERSKLEEKMHVAAVLHALGAELKSQYPVPQEEINNSIVTPWIEGSAAHVEMEILEALREKRNNFTCTDMHAFNEVKQKTLKNSPITQTGVSDTTLTTETVENNAFELLMRQCEYDIQAFKVWQGKVNSIEHHAFHLRLESRQKAVHENRRAASMFMKQYVNFHILETAEGGLRAVNDFCSSCIVDRGCAQSPSDVTVVVLLNWCAPSTLKQKTKSC